MILSPLSMGALGYLLYYPVALLLLESIDALAGDSVWPSVIFAGMLWSFGFLIAGIISHYVTRQGLQKFLTYFTYALFLWTWDYLVWFSIIHFKIVQ